MQVGLVGAGNMARAMARGWGEPVLCSDSGSGRARALVAELGGEALSNREVAERADLVVLCHKPYQREQVAQDIAATDKPIVSVLGATPTEKLQRTYPNVAGVRADAEHARGGAPRRGRLYRPRSCSSNAVDPATGSAGARAVRTAGNRRQAAEAAAGGRRGDNQRRPRLPGAAGRGTGRRRGSSRPHGRAREPPGGGDDRRLG